MRYLCHDILAKSLSKNQESCLKPSSIGRLAHISNKLHTELFPRLKIQVGLQLLVITQKDFRIAVHFGLGVPWSPWWIDS